MKDNFSKIYLYKRVVQAKLYIDNHFSEKIELNNIADEANFSKFHFLRLFKNIYGKTPHQYLTQLRIFQAATFLEKGMTVTDTCFAVGFDSLSSFTGLFKRSLQTTPSSYRLLHLERTQQIKETPLQFVPNCFAVQKGWLQKSNFEEVS